MQRTETINKDNLLKLIEISFSNGEVRFFESYSEPESEILEIKNLVGFKDYYHKSCGKFKHIGFGLYYPETNGLFSIEKIELNPKYCDGKTFRFRTSGWGVINLQLTIMHSDNEIKCTINVNSKKRAEAWSDTYHNMGHPELWDWKKVESKARKLIYNLKKLASEELKNKNKAQHGV